MRHAARCRFARNIAAITPRRDVYRLFRHAFRLMPLATFIELRFHCIFRFSFSLPYAIFISPRCAEILPHIDAITPFSSPPMNMPAAARLSPYFHAFHFRYCRLHFAFAFDIAF
jgi:hypothetical protein